MSLGAPPLDLPAGFCSFPVHLEPVVNKEYGTFTTSADGATIIKESGVLKFAISNQDTGKTTLVNASGPGTVTIYPDGSVTVLGTGHWLIFNPADDAAAFGLPGLMVTSGRLYEALDPSNKLTELSVTGRAIDVCDAISP